MKWDKAHEDKWSCRGAKGKNTADQFYLGIKEGSSIFRAYDNILDVWFSIKISAGAKLINCFLYLKKKDALCRLKCN